jgi:hypothetical protein
MTNRRGEFHPLALKGPFSRQPHRHTSSRSVRASAPNNLRKTNRIRPGISSSTRGFSQFQLPAWRPRLTVHHSLPSRSFLECLIESLAPLSPPSPGASDPNATLQRKKSLLRTPYCTSNYLPVSPSPISATHVLPGSRAPCVPCVSCIRIGGALSEVTGPDVP